MNIAYKRIDRTFIENLEEPLKSNLINYFYILYEELIKSKKRIPKDEFLKNINSISLVFVVHYCPYCKRKYLYTYKGKASSSYKWARYCGFCGETDSYSKAEAGLKKVKKLLSLLDHDFDIMKNGEIRQIILEQVVTLLATSLEVFLRDIYVTSLNILIVKSGITEIERFERECKNDFINIGKTKERYKNELGIDLVNLIGNAVLKDINILFRKRNVFVHNNGIADKSFISQSGVGVKLGEQVKIEFDEVKQYISNTQLMVDKIGAEFEKIFIQEISDVLKSDLRYILSSNTLARICNYRTVYTRVHAVDFRSPADLSKIYIQPLTKKTIR